MNKEMCSMNDNSTEQLSQRFATIDKQFRTKIEYENTTEWLCRCVPPSLISHRLTFLEDSPHLRPGYNSILHYLMTGVLKNFLCTEILHKDDVITEYKNGDIPGQTTFDFDV